MASGQASVDVDVAKVTFDLVLDVTPSDYDEEGTIKKLSSFYGVDASLISLEAAVEEVRRRQERTADSAPLEVPGVERTARRERLQLILNPMEMAGTSPFGTEAGLVRACCSLSTMMWITITTEFLTVKIQTMITMEY